MTGRHIADHRRPSTGAGLRHFMQLARKTRDTWHRPHSKAGATRLIQFLRIARERRA